MARVGCVAVVVVVVVVVAAMAACETGSAALPTDAGLEDAAGDAPVDATPPGQADAGPWGTAGVRVTAFMLTGPECLATLVCYPVPCIPQPPPVTLLRTRSILRGVELRVGTGARLSDGGIEFDFHDRTSPVAPFATVGASYAGAAGPRAPFATEAPVTWGFPLVPEQPLLEVRNARFSGSLDARGLPTSDDPALGGVVTGCFTGAAARRVYLAVLAQTLEELIQSAGGDLDVDCAGSGALDGYAFEAKFEASEVVELQAPDTPDAG